MPLDTPGEVLAKAEDEGAGTISVATVMAVLAAACLAHFIIVVGGLTGDKGYLKLQALETWIQGLLDS